MNRFVALSVGLALLAGCGGPTAGPTPRQAPPPTDPAPPAPAGSAPTATVPTDRVVNPPAAPTGGLRADRLSPVARFRLPGKHVRAYERSVQLSADGKRVALGTDDPKGTMNFTQVWQLGPQPKVLFESPKSFGGGVFALSPGGKRLIVSGTSSPEAFDVDAGKSLGRPTDAYRFSHAYFRDESVAVWTHRSHDYSKPEKRKVYVWDVVKNADAGTFEIPDDRFQVAYPAKDGAELWLFQSAGRFEVECYDVAGRTLARTIKPEAAEPGKPFPSAGGPHAVAPDGSAFAARVDQLRIYDGATGKVVGRLPPDVYGLEEGLVPGGTRYLARTGGDKAKGGDIDPNDLVLLDWKTGRRLAVLGGFSPVPAEPLQGTNADPRAGVSADGKTAVVVSRLGEVLVFDLSGVK